MGAKWERCVRKVKARGGPYNPYAVCTAKVGRLNAKKKDLGPLKLSQRERRREIGNILFDKPKRGFFLNRSDLLFGYMGRKKGLALANPFKVKPFGAVNQDRWTWLSPFKRK